MSLNFIPVQDPYNQRDKQAQFDNLNQTLQHITTQAQQSRQFNMEQALRNQAAKREQSVFDLQNTPLVPPSSAPNPIDQTMQGQPQQDQLPATPSNPLFNSPPGSTGSPQTPQSPIVAQHLQENPHLAPYSPYGGSGGESQPSNPEQPYLDILRNPHETPARQKLASDALGRMTTEELTPYEKKMKESQLSLQGAQTQEAQAGGAYKQAEANMLNSPGGGYKIQNQLEQQGRDLATKIINSRSGDFGIQNGKVSQAIHLRTLLDQYKQVDPKTGEVTYNVPNSQYSELALGLANLLSSGAQAAESTIHSIRQASALGDINQALTYAGFDPKLLGGSTQGILKNLSDSIDRQGMTSEKLREPVLNQIRQQMPTMLNPDVKERIINSLGVNRYRDYMNGANEPNINQGNQGTTQKIGRFNVTVH